MPNKPKLLWEDFALAIAVASHEGARFITILLTTSMSTLVTQATNIEANPLSRILLNFNYLGFALDCVLIGIMIAYYIYLRRSYLIARGAAKEGKKFTFDSFACILLLAFLIDFLGDLAALIGAGIIHI